MSLTLLSLDDEVFINLFQWVLAIASTHKHLRRRRRTRLALSQVNKRFRALATPLLFSSFQCSGQRVGDPFDIVTANRRICMAVRWVLPISSSRLVANRQKHI